jgi:hypothetical protein
VAKECVRHTSAKVLGDPVTYRLTQTHTGTHGHTQFAEATENASSSYTVIPRQNTQAKHLGTGKERAASLTVPYIAIHRIAGFALFAALQFGCPHCKSSLRTRPVPVAAELGAVTSESTPLLSTSGVTVTLRHYLRLHGDHPHAIADWGHTRGLPAPKARSKRPSSTEQSQPTTHATQGPDPHRHSTGICNTNTRCGTASTACSLRTRSTCGQSRTHCARPARHARAAGAGHLSGARAVLTCWAQRALARARLAVPTSRTQQCRGIGGSRNTSVPRGAWSATKGIGHAYARPVVTRCAVNAPIQSLEAELS